MKILKIFFTLAITLTVGIAAAQAPKKILDLSDQFVGYLIDGNSLMASSFFDRRVSQELPPEELSDLWENLQERFGNFKDTGNTFTKKYKESWMIYTRLNFEKTALNLKLVFNPERQISGVFFEPAERKNAYKSPSYADFTKINELKFELISGDYSLPAVLTLPKSMGPHPVVILVHGSGPQDMDETINSNKPFKDLALGLASKGIAVFRYDKRSKVYGAQGGLTIQDEVIDDALSAIEQVKKMERIDSNSIFLLGHSLGGMMAPDIARLSKELKGILLLAANARSLLEMMEIQLGNQMKRLDEVKNQEEIDQLKAVKQTVKNAMDEDKLPHLSAAELPFGVPSEYWVSLSGYNQTEVVKQLKEPIFVMHGGKDQQVFEEDFVLWQKALEHSKHVKLKNYSGLNHIMMESTSDDPVKDYRKKGNVSYEVIIDISEWIFSIP